ncbi:MAG: hypothetical protein R6U51_08685 [Anaerolineales bacterium]
MSLKYSLSVSRLFVDRENWQEGDTPFLRQARQGGHRDIGKALV